MKPEQKLVKEHPARISTPASRITLAAGVRGDE